MSDAIWTFGEARRAMHDASLQQLQHEQNLPAVARDAALKDKTYRGNCWRKRS